MKVAVIGANGQLGSDICEAFQPQHEVEPLTHADIEIADINDVESKLSSINPSLVINTAAYHIVPQCEDEPEKAFSINGLGSLNLARVSQKLSSALVHFSTDYVFDGEKKQPYVEDDLPNPLNVYAVTKLAGENFVRNYCDRHFVVRVSGVYGKVPCRAKGGNFITTMIKAAGERPEVKVVDDEVLTPSSAFDIARNTVALVKNGSYGLYHMTCEGECSWYEFAQAIFEILDLKTPLSSCKSSDFPQTVKRPFYSVLENAELKRIGENVMPGWRDSLESFLKKNYL